MSEKTRELERQVEELRSAVEFLERRVVATENERGKSAAQIPLSPGPSAEDVPYARPFEVDYDPEDGEYYIFAPPGCVLVDGHEVEIADADTTNHTVALDCLDPDDMPDALYAHVTQDASSTGGYKVEFDDEEAKEGALFNFRVCRFGAAENDGDQYDICTSCVTLGVGAIPGPFEPVYGEDGVVGFGKGYVQVGGFTVVSTPTGDYHENPATSGQEIVAVKISVSTSASASGSSGISVELVAYDDDEDLLSAQQSLDYVIYPIYVLAWDEDDHSSITMDLRRMPTTGALETFLTNSSASGGSGS